MSRSVARRLAGEAALAGVAVGSFESARALFALPNFEPAEWALLVFYGISFYALAICALALATLPLLRRAAGRGAEPTRLERLSALAVTAVAIGVWIATLRLRWLVGLSRLDLVSLALGCLLEGAAAGLLAGWALSRLRPGLRRTAWGSLAIVSLLAAASTLAVSVRADRARSTPADARRPNILLISADTLRADRLGAYGWSPSITPNLDRLAGESALFESAFASVALTGPSHSTMLTGLYPVHHGAITNGAAIYHRVETVAEMLAGARYRTAGFVSGWPLTDRSSGLATRFQRYDQNLSDNAWIPDATKEVPLTWLVDRSFMFLRYRNANLGRGGLFIGAIDSRGGEATVERALRWMAGPGREPFFAFVHLYDAHDPYTPPERFRRAVDPGYSGKLDAFGARTGVPFARSLLRDPNVVERIRRLYNGEVAEVDSAVGALLAGLAHLGRADDTLVIFVADHGESMTEHGETFGHGDFLYDTTLHVPLMIRFPRREFAGRRVPEQVRLVDLTPTLLATAGVRSTAAFDGSSLLPLLQGNEAGKERVACGSREVPGRTATSRHYVRAHGFKLIWTFDVRQRASEEPAYEELYDLVADPRELHNLARAGGEAPPHLDELRAAMRTWLLERGEAREVADPEVRNQLISLGYL